MTSFFLYFGHKVKAKNQRHEILKNRYGHNSNVKPHGDMYWGSSPMQLDAVTNWPPGQAIFGLLKLHAKEKLNVV